MVPINSTFIRKSQNYLHHGPQLQNIIKVIQSMTILIVEKKITSSFDEKIPLIKENIMNTDYPSRFINSEPMCFTRVQNVEMKVLQCHLFCLKLQYRSYSLK